VYYIVLCFGFVVLFRIFGIVNSGSNTIFYFVIFFPCSLFLANCSLLYIFPLSMYYHTEANNRNAYDGALLHYKSNMEKLAGMYFCTIVL